MCFTSVVTIPVDAFDLQALDILPAECLHPGAAKLTGFVMLKLHVFPFENGGIDRT